MSEVFRALRSKERRIVRIMAEAEGANIDEMIGGMVAAYADLVDGAPDALPNNPLRRLTASAIRKAGF